MLLKLIWNEEKRLTIQSGVVNVEIYLDDQRRHCLRVEYQNGSKISYLLTDYTEDGIMQDICTAYLMNDKGETIEKIQ